MTKYRATVRVLNVEAKNPRSAQESVEDRLKAAGLDGWRIVSIEEDGRKPALQALPHAARKTRSTVDSGVVLIAAAAALALLFFLSLAL